jgi:(1->4)-alpha-D-glucan 1-alpha-D-glucosylmutase
MAKTKNPATNESVFDAIGSILLLEDPDGITAAQKAERRLFVMRLQQLTGPVMAKGVEDTAFYRYHPLASLNEVGGDPDEFGMSRRMFHHKNLIRLKRWPRALLATATHDTKRSEDVRARINVLSEIPGKWFEAVHRWSAMNRSKKTVIEGVETPDRNAEHFLYQTLVGVWPFENLDELNRDEFVRRIQEYMDKALKEAKLDTSWINPNEKYDRAVRDFVEAVLSPGNQSHFLDDFSKFVAPVARAGIYNSLSQVLLKIASPGTPDFYQGSESWDFSLVDPDNRRPVDFAKCRVDLETIIGLACTKAELIADLLRTSEDGRIKMYVTRCGLRYRGANAALFEAGSYHPVESEGARKRQVIALERSLGEQNAIAVAGRFFYGLEELSDPGVNTAWRETELVLPQKLKNFAFEDVLSGHITRPQQRGNSWILPLAEVFGHLPVALLKGRPTT